MLMRTIAAIVVLAGVLVPAEAHAYMDPGTGSILLQGLIAAVAAGLAIGRMYWAKLKAFFKGGPRDEPPEGGGASPG